MEMIYAVILGFFLGQIAHIVGSWVVGIPIAFALIKARLNTRVVICSTLAEIGGSVLAVWALSWLYNHFAGQFPWWACVYGLIIPVFRRYMEFKKFRQISQSSLTESLHELASSNANGKLIGLIVTLITVPITYYFLSSTK